jgi:transcriptional regulator with XRE-family HTH domain
MTTKNNDLIDARVLMEKMLGPFSFAIFMRGTRVNRDMTQKQFAKKLGMSPGTVCDIEKGRQLVSPALAKKIAKKLGMPEKLAVQACLQDQLRKAKINYTVELVA